MTRKDDRLPNQAKQQNETERVDTYYEKSLI